MMCESQKQKHPGQGAIRSRSLFTAKRLWFSLVALIVLLVLVGVWVHVRPYVFYALIDFSEGRDEPEPIPDFAAAHLAACGADAVPLFVEEVRKYSLLREKACYIPDILKEIGPPAHKRILEEVVAEKGPAIRADLIYFLQAGFDDYSWTDVWFESLRKGEVNYISLIRMETYLRFNVKVQDDSRINAWLEDILEAHFREINKHNAIASENSSEDM